MNDGDWVSHGRKTTIQKRYCRKIGETIYKTISDNNIRKKNLSNDEYLKKIKFLGKIRMNTFT